MNKFVVPKLIGLATLTMITLVVLSFIEVTVYSYLINPGQNESVYEAHANASAPYISAIFGFVIFFLVVRFWKKKQYPNLSRLALLFPLIYVLVDVILLTVAGVSWADFILVFAIANMAKALGSYLGYKS